MPPSNIRLLPVAATRASLAIDGPASATFNTVIEASSNDLGGNGNLITLALASGGTWVPNKGILTLTGNATRANAVGTLTLVAQPSDTETVTIDANVYTFQTVLTNVAGNVLIGASASDTLDNLIACVNAGAGSGTLYAAASVVHPTVVAAAGALDTMTATARTSGIAGNSIATTDGMANAGNVWGAVTLENGAVAETVTIGSTVYTFVNHLTTAFHVMIGAAATNTCDNLIAAINLNGTAGTHYATGTTVHPTVRAYAGASDTVDVYTKTNTILTAVGTLIATTQTMASGTWGATTLADGTNGTNVTFTVTGNDIAGVFATGYSTVSDFEAAILADSAVATLIRTKTAGTTPLYQLLVTDDDFSATALTGGGATSSAVPTAGSDTVGMDLPFCTDQITMLVRSVAGSGTMTADLRLWGFHYPTLTWYNLGRMNGEAAISEVSTDLIAHAEPLIGMRKFSRLYCEIESLGGTGTEIEVYADCIPASPVSD